MKVKSLPRVPLQKIERGVLIEYFNNRVPEDTVRLFASEDRMSRVRIYRKDGVVGIISEQLELFEEEELNYTIDYGWWSPENLGFKSIYDSVETASRENAHLIEGMNEVLLPLQSKGKYKIKFIRPKKFSACLQKVPLWVDGDNHLIKNGQTVEVDVGSGMHVIVLDGNPYLLTNLNTDCEFLIKTHSIFAITAYFTLEKVDK